MTADDLTRRAIIAAHDAECMNGDNCMFRSEDEYPKLNVREQAIVALWRADVETKSVVHECCEARQTAERAAQTLNGVIEQHARMILDITGLHDRIDDDGDGDWGAIWDHAHELRPRAEAAEAAIERALAIWREHMNTRGPGPANCKCIGCVMARALDGTEATS